MLAKSECPLWNAVNKMLLSRVWDSAIAGEWDAYSHEGATSTYLEKLILFHVKWIYFTILMCLEKSFKPPSSLIWLYLCNHCHPCPHCRRLTGQTSADQGLHCAQTISVTDDTSFQITCEPTWKRAHCVMCFCSVFVFHGCTIFAFTDFC